MTEFIDMTPTWMGVLQMAKSLAGFNNPSLLTILGELEKPCQLVDEWNHALKNSKEHQPKEINNET